MIVDKLKAFGWFWYDFIIGDDWTIAAGVLLILGITRVLDEPHFGLTWLFLLAATLVLLYVCVRRGIRPKQ
jgi:hypothetical protein